MKNCNPDQPETLLEQVLSAISRSDWELAENRCRQVLALHENHPDASYLLGLVYQNSGRNSLAITWYEKVLLREKCHTDALNNLGTIHETAGDVDKALNCYRNAVECSPTHLLANYNLGRISRLRGELDTAVEALSRIAPSGEYAVPVLLELGLALKDRGNYPQALANLERARDIAPDNPAIYNMLGNTCQKYGRIKQALLHYRTAIEINPGFALAHNNLGSACIAMGDVPSALASYRRAVEAKPDWNGAVSNLLLAENYVSDNQADLYRKHLEWGSSFKATELPGQHNNNCHNRRIRIGYVSPDLRAHSVAWFLMAIFRNYDHDAFHVTCFSDTVAPDTVSREIGALVDDWLNISGLSDDDALDRIKQCNIDILVDLAGHTANNRLGVFARQAAPLQVTYLGYPNTTGLKSVGYRITDSFADPPGDADRLHTEKLVRLPGCFLCYTPSEEAPGCASPPCNNSPHITFGSFNVLAKLSHECIKTWCAILHRIPDSCLILKSAGLDDPDTMTFIRGRFRKHGIDPGRLEMIPRTKGMKPHLQQYDRVDIALDTFPYNGTTTTCEALWMGVPVVCLAGNRHASRVGYTLLSQVGLQELVAETPEQYISLASRLAGNTEQIDNYHRTLRTRVGDSPLCNGARFTLSLENAFRAMLQL